MPKHESKFWQKVKEKLSPYFILNRMELATISGFPDIVLYNKNGTFATIELKVTQTNLVRLSPHQIGFHIRHPKNTFILVSAASLSMQKLNDKDSSDSILLYKGSSCSELAAQGLKLAPFVTGWELIIQHFASL